MDKGHKQARFKGRNTSGQQAHKKVIRISNHPGKLKQKPQEGRQATGW